MARRVNKKFLIVFSIVVLGLVAAAVVFAFPIRARLKATRMKEALAQADRAMVEADDKSLSAQAKKEKLETAVRNYLQAAGSDTKNADLWVKLGDAYTKLTLYDVFQYIRASRQAWNRALEINPSHLTAQRRLMDSYYQETQLSPNAQVFTQLEDRAAAIHRLDPKDRRAHALMFIAPLNQWLANLETPPGKIDIAIQELTQLLEQDPKHADNADLVFFAAAAKAKRGAELRRIQAEGEGNKLLAQARQLFDEGVKAQDENPAMHFRYFELLQVLRSEDRERDAQQRYTETIKRELERARDLVGPEHRDYVKICIAAHQQYIGLRQPTKAEQILMEAQQNKKNDQRLRLALAKFWRYNPQKRSEAIALLKLPIENIGFEGVEARRRLGLEIETNIELTTMLVDEYAQSRDMPREERDKRLAEIELFYQRAYDKAGEISAVLKLRGKLELLRGGIDAPIRAIKSFEKAQTQFKIETGREDLDLMFLLARAYMASNMTGQAKQQLLRFMDKSRDYIPVRMLLAQVLVTEGDLAGARDHVEFLRGQAPEDPDVLKLSIAVANPEKEKDLIAQYLGKLPEATRAEQVNKAMVAASNPSNNLAEALRLYGLVLKADPADFEAVNATRELYMALSRERAEKKDEAGAKALKEQALGVLRAAQQAKPNDKRFSLIMTQIQGASLEEVERAARDLIMEMYSDPFQRELKLYEFEMVRGQGAAAEKAKACRAEAHKHLVEAEKLKPEDGRVLDLLFQYHLGEQNWAKASEYVDKLAAKNWDTADGLIYRFRMAMVRNDIPAATGYARDMTTRFSEFARSWVFLAQAYQATGTQAGYEQAVNNYSVALDKQTENIDALAGIISCYYRMERPNDAFRYIQQAVKYHPNNVFFREQLKAWHMTFPGGDPSKVLAQAVADRDARPDDVGRWIALGRVQFAAARKGGADAANHMTAAKTTFMQAAKKFPGERMVWAHMVDLAEFTKDVAFGENALTEMAGLEAFKKSPDPLTLRADLYLRFNDSARAEETMKKAVAQFPEVLDLRRRLAAFYTQKQKYDEALKLLDPSSPDKLIRQQIVEIYMLDRKFPEAEKLLRGLIAANANDAQLHALLGVVLLNQNRSQQAMEEMDTALKLDPRNLAALYSRGTLYLGDNPPKLDAAIKDLVTLRDVSSAMGSPHIEGRVKLADAFRAKGERESAIRELENALLRAPGRDDVRVTLCGLRAAAKPPEWAEVERLLKTASEREPKRAMWKRMEAKMLSARNQHDRAVGVIRDAIALAATDVERGDMARDYFDILEAAKNWPQLLVECDQALKTDPKAAKDAWWIYVKRAIARRNRNMANEAMADFTKAFEIAQEQGNPDVLFSIVDKIRQHMGVQAAIDRVTILVTNAKGKDVSRWKIVLAYLYLADNNNRRAQELVEEARADIPNMEKSDRKTTLIIAGEVFMRSNEYDKARTVYDELLTLKPDDLAALNNLACMMAEHVQPPNLAKALDYSTKAFEVMQKRSQAEASVLDTHGWVNVLIGGTNLNTGIELLNQSIRTNEIPEAHYHLAEAYMLKKFPKQARDSLMRGLDLIQERQTAGQPVDPSMAQLKKKIEEALQKAEKALLEAAKAP